MLTVVAVGGVLGPVGFTAHRILGRVRSFAAERARTRTLRSIVDAFSRELGVGAFPVDAAGHALAAVDDTRGVGRELVEQLAVEVRRVRLGAQPGEGTSADGESSVDPDVERLLNVWASANRHGSALGRLMDRLRADLDARLTHLSHTSSALAGARLTETILLLLPFGALALGQSMGLNPGVFLVGNVLGVLLLVVGVLLGCAGALWTESLTVTVLGGVGRRAGPSPLDAAPLLDLFAESLSSGLPVSVAWHVAATCGDADAGAQDADGGDGGVGGDRGEEDCVRTVAALLALGAGAEAWEPLRDDPHLGPVARLAESGSRNGARLAEGVRAQATRLRAEAADASLAGAERVLVVVAAPLTLCFLPAFVLVGLIPLVVGFAGI
jgi:tight adherence protein B